MIQLGLDTPVFCFSSNRILWSQKFSQSDFYAFQLSIDKVLRDQEDSRSEFLCKRPLTAIF